MFHCFQIAALSHNLLLHPVELLGGIDPTQRSKKLHFVECKQYTNSLANKKSHLIDGI